MLVKPSIGVYGYISGIVTLFYLATLLVCAFLIDWRDVEYRYGSSKQKVESLCPPVFLEDKAKAFGLPALNLGR